MNLRRLAAFSVSLLLNLGTASMASAHPWHAPSLPASGDGHAPAPTPHMPPPHFHGGAPSIGNWHVAPASSSGPHFGGGGDRWHHGGDHDWDHHHWHHDWGHGDIRFFDDDDDWFAWQNGYWYNGWYGPHFGWWWVVSGVWFFYPVPVYPYPNPYVPSGWAAPPPAADQSVPAAGSYWYFCPASNGYYPYVPSCPTGWQQVPAQPASAQPAAQQPPPPDGPPGG